FTGVHPLSSARRRFTFLFGMGRSGATLLWSSSITGCGLVQRTEPPIWKKHCAWGLALGTTRESGDALHYSSWPARYTRGCVVFSRFCVQLCRLLHTISLCPIAVLR